VKSVLRRPEAVTVAALVDAVAAPEPPLPPVAATDAVASFAIWLAHAPRVNRAGLRALVAGLRLVRFASLDRAARLAVLAGFGRLALTRPLGEALRATAAVSYYGDRGVLLALGYDPAARVREARERRAREVSA